MYSLQRQEKVWQGRKEAYLGYFWMKITDWIHGFFSCWYLHNTDLLVTRQILNLHNCRTALNNRWQYFANGRIERFGVLADDTFCLTSLATDLITLITSWEAGINYSLNLPKKSFLSHVFCFKIIYTWVKRQFSSFSVNILYSNSVNSPSENGSGSVKEDQDMILCARHEGDAWKLHRSICYVSAAVSFRDLKQDAWSDLLHLFENKALWCIYISASHDFFRGCWRWNHRSCVARFLVSSIFNKHKMWPAITFLTQKNFPTFPLKAILLFISSKEDTELPLPAHRQKSFLLPGLFLH